MGARSGIDMLPPEVVKVIVCMRGEPVPVLFCTVLPGGAMCTVVRPLLLAATGLPPPGWSSDATCDATCISTDGLLVTTSSPAGLADM